MEIWVHGQKGKNTNLGTKDEPLKSIWRALELCPDHQAHKIWTEGIIYDGLSVKKRKFESLKIDSQKKTLIYGFEGKYQPFDPRDLPVGNYKAASFMDCHGVTWKNGVVWGGSMQTISIDDSYPEIGIDGLILNGITAYFGQGRTIFQGAVGNVKNIALIDVEAAYTCFWPATSSHNVYISGGHWAHSSGVPMSNYLIQGLRSHHAGGRHGLQINAKAQGIKIYDSDFALNELGGISLIGTQDVDIQRCRFALNHRAPIILYHYFDEKYFDKTTKEGRAIWHKVHHPISNVRIKNNTLLVGPKPWANWHGNVPDGQPVIEINNAIYRDPLMQLEPELLKTQMFSGIRIQKNIMANPCNQMMVRFGGVQEAWATSMYGNMMWTYGRGPALVKIPFGDVLYPVGMLQMLQPNMYSANLEEDPMFKEIPYCEYVDVKADPTYDFTKHPASGDLTSVPGTLKGIGWKPNKANVAPDFEALRKADIEDAGKEPIPWELGAHYSEMEA